MCSNVVALPEHVFHLICQTKLPGGHKKTFTIEAMYRVFLHSSIHFYANYFLYCETQEAIVDCYFTY